MIIVLFLLQLHCILFLRTNWQRGSISSDNGLVPEWRQVIIWTYDDPVILTGVYAFGLAELTHLDRVAHICVSKLTIIGSDNGSSPGLRQAIIWTNAGILLIGPLETNFSEFVFTIHTFSFKKMHFKMSSGDGWPFCFSLNVLMEQCLGQCQVILIGNFIPQLIRYVITYTYFPDV